MSKKLHLLVAALGLFIGNSVNAQVVLSQTNNQSPIGSTVACAVGASPNFEGISESHYFRAYTMSSNFTIGSVRLGVGSVTGSFPITVTLHTSSSAFPASYPAGLTQIATTTATLNSSQDESLVDIPLSSTVSVNSGDIVVVEVKNINTSAAQGGNGSLHFMGRVATESESGYILAAGCQFPTPTIFTTLNPDAKIVIDLVEGVPGSSQDFFKENFSMYPNPVTDVLNITSINGLNVNEIKVMDVTGKVVKVQNNASSVNVADLTAGTYLIDITTNEGKATSKFIKK